MDRTDGNREGREKEKDRRIVFFPHPEVFLICPEKRCTALQSTDYTRKNKNTNSSLLTHREIRREKYVHRLLKDVTLSNIKGLTITCWHVEEIEVC